MTTHNHITSVLNIFKRKNQRKKWLMLFLLLLPALATAQKKQKLIMQTSDVHSRIEPMTQERRPELRSGWICVGQDFLQQFRKENWILLLFDCGAISQNLPLL